MHTFRVGFVCAFSGALMACNVATLHAAPLATHTTATKPMVADNSSMEIRWVGWRGGGWGYRRVGGWGHRGWGYRGLGWGGAALAGAVIGGAIASNPYGYYGAPYDAYDYYGGPYYGGYYPPSVEEYAPSYGYYVQPYSPYGYGYGWGALNGTNHPTPSSTQGDVGPGGNNNGTFSGYYGPEW